MTLPHSSVIPDGSDGLHNTSMLQMIPSLTDKNSDEFFRTLEWVGSLGNWSKPQMLVIAKLKLEGRVRQFLKLYWQQVFPQTCGYNLEYNFQNIQDRENSSFKEVNKSDHSVYNFDVTFGRAFSKVTIPPLSQRYVDIKLDNPPINAESSSKPFLIEKEKNSLSTSFLVSRSVSNLLKSSPHLTLV
ncbi:hypothetical protein AVEN_105425-1 [Araneus ventricosus]|uniref:Uncharacterized protein n=1 Tax=Araneus ventricosus TaxID=182803 RepID=A0A4Y2IF01_ARAVE|nr:hypothetical protein AVEN_105425-1 [Araneus ventricosus]